MILCVTQSGQEVVKLLSPRWCALPLHCVQAVCWSTVLRLEHAKCPDGLQHSPGTAQERGWGKRMSHTPPPLSPHTSLSLPHTSLSFPPTPPSSSPIPLPHTPPSTPPSNCRCLSLAETSSHCSALRTVATMCGTPSSTSPTTPQHVSTLGMGTGHFGMRTGHFRMGTGCCRTALHSFPIGLDAREYTGPKI